jgi:hypothetical protein
MAKKKKLRRIRSRMHYLFAIIGIIFLSVGSWAVFSIFNQGVVDILTHFGITNFYIQRGAVILLVLIGLLFSGMSIWKAFGKIARGS